MLVLISGLPGSGKTTHARVVELRLSAIRFSADDWLEELALDLWDEDRRTRQDRAAAVAADEAASGRRSLVVIEWGTWCRAERDRIRVEAQRLDARTELLHLAAPSEVLYQRVVHRGREEPAIGRQQIAQWQAAFEVPSPDETERWDHFESINAGTDRR